MVDFTNELRIQTKLNLRNFQVSAGDSHSVALSEGGNVYYWGTFRDSSGSFGLTPDGSVQKLPVALAHHLDVAKISSGSDHIALLTTAGQLYTLGCGEQVFLSCHLDDELRVQGRKTSLNCC